MDRLGTWVLGQAAQRSHQILHARLGEAGFTGHEYRCLAVLLDSSPLGQTDVGRLARLDRADVANTLARLERRGLVLREKDPAHGRRLLVALTPEGQAAATGLSGTMQQIQDEVFGVLDAGERDTLISALRRLS